MIYSISVINTIIVSILIKKKIIDLLQKI